MYCYLQTLSYLSNQRTQSVKLFIFTLNCKNDVEKYHLNNVSPEHSVLRKFFESRGRRKLKFYQYRGTYSLQVIKKFFQLVPCITFYLQYLIPNGSYIKFFYVTIGTQLLKYAWQQVPKISFGPADNPLRVRLIFLILTLLGDCLLCEIRPFLANMIYCRFFG